MLTASVWFAAFSPKPSGRSSVRELPAGSVCCRCWAHGSVACLLITLRWKLSIHPRSDAAMALFFAIIFGAPLLALQLPAVLVSWARIPPRRVVGGGLNGAAMPVIEVQVA